MASENETVADIVRDARDKYTVHHCNECNWRKSCEGKKFGDSECLSDRESISLLLGIEDGYFSELLDRIESAWRREKAELQRRLKVAEDALKEASDAFRFCIEQCELELGPRMVSKLCDDGKSVERDIATIAEGGEK